MTMPCRSCLSTACHDRAAGVELRWRKLLSMRASKRHGAMPPARAAVGKQQQAVKDADVCFQLHVAWLRCCLLAHTCICVMEVAWDSCCAGASNAATQALSA